MSATTVAVDKVQCNSDDCGHEWKPRSDPPYKCPDCGSTNTSTVAQEAKDDDGDGNGGAGGEPAGVPTPGGTRSFDPASEAIEALFGYDLTSRQERAKQNALNAIQQNSEKYLESPSKLTRRLRAAGFNSDEADAIVEETEDRMDDPTGTWGTGGNGSSSHDTHDRVDRMMDRVMDIYEMNNVMNQMGPVLESLSDGGGGGGFGGGGGGGDFQERLLMLAAVSQMFGGPGGQQQGQADDGGEEDIQMVTIPAGRDEDGNMQTRQVPVQGEGSAMMQWMMPMMSNSGGSSQAMAQVVSASMSNMAEMAESGPDLESIATIIGELKDDGDQNDELLMQLIDREREEKDKAFEFLKEQAESSSEDDPWKVFDKLQQNKDVFDSFLGGDSVDEETQLELLEVYMDQYGDVMDEKREMMKMMHELEREESSQEMMQGFVENALPSIAMAGGQMFGGMGGGGGGAAAPTAGQQGGAAGGGAPAGGGTPAAGGGGAGGGGNSTERIKEKTPKAVDHLAQQGEEEHLKALRNRIDRYVGDAGAAEG